MASYYKHVNMGKPTALESCFDINAQAKDPLTCDEVREIVSNVYGEAG